MGTLSPVSLQPTLPYGHTVNSETQSSKIQQFITDRKIVFIIASCTTACIVIAIIENVNILSNVWLAKGAKSEEN